MTLLVVVDPLGLTPIFAALTRGYPEKRKREVATRGTVIGATMLLLFTIAGDVLLEALGISILAFRIAGGVLLFLLSLFLLSLFLLSLFLLSLDMIFASPSGLRSRTVREQEEISYEEDVSVFPLAIPLLAGPGALATVLLYAGERNATELVVFVAVLLAFLLLGLVSLLLAPRIMRLFGETGSNVLTRVLGVLLAALAVQFVLDGLGASLA